MFVMYWISGCCLHPWWNIRFSEWNDDACHLDVCHLDVLGVDVCLDIFLLFCFYESPVICFIMMLENQHFLCQ